MHRFNAVAFFALSAFSALSACDRSPARAPADATPVAPTFEVRGTIATRDESISTALLGVAKAPLPGAKVRLHCDRNSDGRLDPAEFVETITDASGAYAARLALSGPCRVVLTASHQKTARAHRTFAAAGPADFEVHLELARVEPLSCSSGSCTSGDGRLRVAALPPGVSARGQTFDPTTEKAAFPGAFRDSGGKLLVSGGFSSVELTNGKGQPVTRLESPAELTMAIPRATWPIVTDIRPGTASIEYPLYSFDEVSGEWVRDGEGVLESEAGVPIPEASLGEVRTGAWTRGVYATGKVRHFTWWNVDWPISSFGCVTGIIVDADDRPVTGAVVSVSGETYNGTSMPRTTGADGQFCAEAMRSESEQEDVDLDGQRGEQQRVSVIAARAGALVSTTGVMRVGHAECGDACLDVGRLKLDRATVSRCELRGRVVDKDGAPRSARVTGVRPMGASAGAVACELSECSLETAASRDGWFALRVPSSEPIQLLAVHTAASDAGTRLLGAERRTMPCPSEPVSLVLTERGVAAAAPGVLVAPAPVRLVKQEPLLQGQAPVRPEDAELPRVDRSSAGDRLSWPFGPASRIRVTGANGIPKWRVEARGAGLASPVVYGKVPANATERTRAIGPLESGDQVRIELESGSEWSFTAP